VLAGLRHACAETAAPPARRAALAAVHFVAYTLRGFDRTPAGPIDQRRPRRPRAAAAHFDSLVTYSSARTRRRSGIARELGSRGRASASGIRRATRARTRVDARAEPDVLALALGNEGLFFERYDRAALASAFARARSAVPGVALTTSEPFSSYLDERGADALPAQDLALPIVHPIDQPWFGTAPFPETAVEFVANVVRELETRTGLPVLVKETGVPSGPADQGFDESRQTAFWTALAARMPPTRAHAFVWFEAFDHLEARVAREARRERAQAHWGSRADKREPLSESK
jgi:hypothetical protein